VGKSTFFNRITGRKIAIVENMPGVTRDRIYADTDWCGYSFTLIDTGGLEVRPETEMWRHMKRQVEIAADIAELILFMVDAKHGLTTEDYEAADFVRRLKKPYLLVANKVDNNNNPNIADFYRLGMGEPIEISAEQGRGLGDLLDLIVQNLKKKVEPDEPSNALKIAIVGKPNAGKSTVVNRLLGYDRVIVSEIAGTTRDAIDTEFIYDGAKYILIDTAGIRRKRSVEENVEYYSVVRAFEAIRRSDIVLVVVDSTEKLTEQDTRILGFVHEEGKPSVVLMNKWDAVEKDGYTMNAYNKELAEELKFMDYFIPVYASALKGTKLNNLMPALLTAYGNASKRIPTGVLNDILREAISVNEPPVRNGKKLKIYYITQPAVNPPTFVVFVNDDAIIHFSYKRYLENCIRKAVDYSGTPIRLIIRNKSKEIFEQ